MSVIECHYLNSEFGRMHFRTAGELDSAVLLCLHMAPQSSLDFVALMKAEAGSRFFIAPDYHGHGESSPFSEIAQATIENHARSIWQLIDQLGISDRRIDILGYHTGSKVAIEMALQRPENISDLSCISLSTMTPEQFKEKEVAFGPIEPGLAGEGLRDWWNTLEAYYDPEMASEVLMQKFATSLRTGPYFHWGFVASHRYNENIIAKLRSLQTPMTLINPKDDLHEITPLAAQYIEHCQLVHRPNWLPGFLETQPNAILSTLLKCS